MTVGGLVMLLEMQKKQLLIYCRVVIKEYISYVFLEVQQQRDGSSCCVFAVAFVHTLAEGKDPSSLEFSDEANLRTHLLKCITAKKWLSFTQGRLYTNQEK